MKPAGQALREARIRARLSQDACAKALRITWQAWGAYERGTAYIPDRAWEVCGVKPPWKDPAQWGTLDWRIGPRKPRHEGRRDFGMVRRHIPESRDTAWKDRHRAIARIIAANPGMSNAAIGRALDVSDMTVMRHRRRLCLTPDDNRERMDP